MYLLKENNFDVMLFALPLHLKSLPDPHMSCPVNHFFQIENETVHVKNHLRLEMTQMTVYEILQPLASSASCLEGALRGLKELFAQACW
jgi:hypothetical protein